MSDEIRTVYYDADLQIEAYRFQGIMQKFPNHFHDYYVIGFIEDGERCLLCRNKEYIVKPGDIVIFNPKDTHTCESVGGRTLDYRCLNIQPDIMRRTVLDITGKDFLPCFNRTVLYRSELAASLTELHQIICDGKPDFIKDELYLFLLEQLILEYADVPAVTPAKEPDRGFQIVRDYLEKNYKNTITLTELCGLAGLSKYHFLRSFTKEMGISPYCYLETVRISNAKKLLEQGILPVEAAFMTGFNDQSHFTYFFKKLIGLTPRQYMRIFQNEAKQQTCKEAQP